MTAEVPLILAVASTQIGDLEVALVAVFAAVVSEVVTVEN